MRINTMNQALRALRIFGPKLFKFVILWSFGAALFMGSIGSIFYVIEVGMNFSWERILQTYQIILVQGFLSIGGIALAFLIGAALFYKTDEPSDSNE